MRKRRELEDEDVAMMERPQTPPSRYNKDTIDLTSGHEGDCPGLMNPGSDEQPAVVRASPRRARNRNEARPFPLQKRESRVEGTLKVEYYIFTLRKLYYEVTGRRETECGTHTSEA